MVSYLIEEVIIVVISFGHLARPRVKGFLLKHLAFLPSCLDFKFVFKNSMADLGCLIKVLGCPFTSLDYSFNHLLQDFLDSSFITASFAIIRGSLLILFV